MVLVNMNFFTSLLSKGEGSTDSVVFLSIVVVFVICLLTGFSVLVKGQPFPIVEFTASCSGVIGTNAGSKRLRDGVSNASG